MPNSSEPGSAAAQHPQSAQTKTPASDYDSSAEEPLNDDSPADTDYAPESRVTPPEPFAGLDDAALDKLLRDDPQKLGSMSIGKPNNGALFNGIALQPDDYFALADASHAWGTEETVTYLHDAIRDVWRQFPHTPRLYIGHISARRGGPLRPHVSHQCGRDVDVGFFYLDQSRWYARGTRDNLDLARTWAFVRALIADTDVELILIDHSIQTLLREYALSIGEDPDWVKGIFAGIPGRAPSLIRHASGHDTHMHVRFYNPIAQQAARRLQGLLVTHHLIAQGPTYIEHRVKPGETLGMLSRKYGVSVQAIRAANNLRGNVIRANTSYKIPQTTTRPLTPMPPIIIPARRVPPPRTAAAAQAK